MNIIVRKWKNFWTTRAINHITKQSLVFQSKDRPNDMGHDLFWCSLMVPDGSRNDGARPVVFIAKGCCANHAMMDAMLILGVPHGICVVHGPAHMDVPESLIGRELTEAEARSLGAKTEAEFEGEEHVRH